LENGEEINVEIKDDENDSEIELSELEPEKETKKEDSSTIELNTEGWDSENKPAKVDGESPFMVSGDGGNGPLSQDDKENMQTDEVMSIYEKKYGKKTFFEEMWEKNHPEEAKQLHDEEVNKEKMKQEEA